jgi:hypothetical protein
MVALLFPSAVEFIHLSASRLLKAYLGKFAKFAYLLPVCIIRCKEVIAMKIKHYFTEEERSSILRALNEMRNQMISEGEPVDFVSDVIAKVWNAKTKSVRIAK